MKFNRITITILISFLSLEARTPQQKSYDNTVRYQAGQHRGTDVVKYYIQLGGLVNVPDKLGTTALHKAAGVGNVETIKVLMAQIPKNKLSEYIFMKDKEGLTALHWAARSNNVAALNFLLNSLAENLRMQGMSMQDKYGRAPLHLAVYFGAKDTVKALLDRGANINQKLKNGMTPLHMADWDPGMIEVLIQRMPVNRRKNLINEINTDKRNALHFVAIRGNAPAAQKLIDAGIIMYAKNFQDRTPLHEAANFGHTKMVTVLLENIPTGQKAAFINQSNLWGSTALHEAAKKGHLATVKVLLQHGIDPSIKDRTGKTALDYAREKKHNAVVNVLKNAKPPTTQKIP